MIPRGITALVRILMLFIDDDHLQILKRCENRTSGTDDKLDFRSFYAPPLGDSLRVGKARMQYGHIVLKPFHDLKGKLMSQRYFRNKVDDLSALSYYLFGTAQKHLRLS